MFYIADIPKTEIFTKTDSSSLSSSFAGKVRIEESMACVLGQPIYTAYTMEPALPVVPRSSYEWVVTTSSTLEFSSRLSALVAASDAALETSRESTDYAVQNVLVATYKLDEGGFGRLAAQEVMLFVEKNLRRNCLTEANRLLELADASKLSSRSLIGLIRATARLKDRLPAWKNAYLKSRDAVVKQGKNPDSLFLGLPKVQKLDEPKTS